MSVATSLGRTIDAKIHRSIEKFSADTECADISRDQRFRCEARYVGSTAERSLQKMGRCDLFYQVVANSILGVRRKEKTKKQTNKQTLLGFHNGCCGRRQGCMLRSEEHTSELQSLMRISYAVLCLTTKRSNTQTADS